MLLWVCASSPHFAMLPTDTPQSVFVPNCCRKTHKMTSTGPGTWAGKLGGKKITLTKVSDTELMHVTTDGPMRMTRDDPQL